MNGIVQSYVPKLVMIPVSLATAFGLTLVPTITRSFVNKDYNVLQKQIDQTYQTIMFLVLPASVGLMALAGPAYTFSLEQMHRMRVEMSCFTMHR